MKIISREKLEMNAIVRYKVDITRRQKSFNEAINLRVAEFAVVETYDADREMKNYFRVKTWI